MENTITYGPIGLSEKVSEAMKFIQISCYVLALLILLIFCVIYFIKIKKCTSDEEKQKLNESTRSKILPLILVLAVIILLPSCSTWIFGKPIIYIYPEQETDLQITLGNPNSITNSYPDYFANNGWQVKAFPNGDLIDLNTDKKLYSLYWEGRGNKLDTSMKEGFCVKGEDSAKFLEEKLSQLGLNYKEAEEFIVYWLPKLEKNNYNYIRFATTEECNYYMPLNIQSINEDGTLKEAKVDNLIRVLMIYKPLIHKIDVNEQKIKTPSREGFTIVEWGGSKI